MPMTLAAEIMEWYGDLKAYRYRDFTDGVLTINCARYQLPFGHTDNQRGAGECWVLVLQRLNSTQPGSGRFKQVLTELEVANPPGMMIQSLELGGRLMHHLDNRKAGWEPNDNGASRIRWHVENDQPTAA